LKKHIEQLIVFLHVKSIPNEIKQYRLTYTEFIRERNAEPSFNDYINELVENEQKYPLLNFFTLTRNQIENIQLIYPIVNFTNYLLQKYNHRILRNEAATNDIQYYLTSNDEHNSSIAILGYLQTLAKLQNTIVNYYRQIDQPVNELIEDEKTRLQLIQSLTSEHLLELNSETMFDILSNDGFVMNYEYDKTKEILYGYDEIEIKLRNMISKIRLIGTDKLYFFNYQFELYNQDVLLFNDIRWVGVLLYFY
ncbi:unnamed protein product, partial [Didymodactylos carnosus]